MKRLLIAVPVVLLLALSLSAPPAGGQPAKPPAVVKWEYKSIRLNDISAYGGKYEPNLDKGLNRLGEEGWELAAIETVVFPYTTSGPVHPSPMYVFKRQK